MDLLPKSHKEFSSAEYWERFFKKRGNQAFEWYGQYQDLCGVIHKYMKQADKTLVIGCGNSRLSADLYDVGYHDIRNIDISEVVIKQMSDQNSKSRPDMKFIQMDLTKMTFADNEFSVVLDKGTLDALLTDSSEETIQRIDTIFGEIGRVLKVGGRYICISLAQEHILNKVLEYFPKEGWIVRVHRIIQDNDLEDREFQLPVFAFVFTKLMKLPNFKPIFEVGQFDDTLERLETAEKVCASIQGMQQYSLVRHHLQKKQQKNEQLSLDLYSSASTKPRYTLHIVDHPKQRAANRFAVFIVPEGRETEWLFSSDEGRRQLSDSAGFGRLVVVSLNRDHSYAGLESVKNELSEKVLELAPADLGRIQVPFLSAGDDINKRQVRYRGNSEMSGNYVVEDVEVDNGATFRRLIFLANQNIVQSEAKLRKESGRTKGGKKKAAKFVVDPTYLANEHHHSMVAGLVLVDNFKQILDTKLSTLLVGLGGGGLPHFIHHFFPKIWLDIVDIDPAMLTIATEWFNFPKDDRLQVNIADGLQYIKDQADKGVKLHAVMLDVDSKDSTMGMSCPPKPFIHTTMLQHIKSLLLPGGVFMLNLVCREQKLREEATADLKTVFPYILTINIPEQVNEIIYAFPEDRQNTLNFDLGSKGLPKHIAGYLKTLVEGMREYSKTSSVPRLTQKLDGLHLIG